MTTSPYSLPRLKRAAAHFVLGRAVSAVLTFLAFALLARALDLSQYGLYAVGLSVAEMGIGLSLLGIDAAINRLLPEYRLHATASRTIRLTWKLSLLQASTLAAGALAVFLGSDAIAAMTGHPADGAVVRVFAGVVLVEGLARMARDQVLGALLNQGWSQITQVLRAAAVVGYIVVAQPTTALEAAQMELLASSVGALAGWAAVLLVMGRLRRTPTTEDDSLPSLDKAKVARLAWHSYLGSVMWMAYSAHVVVMVISRFAGADAAGLFGFARGLSELIRRYLPAEFFIGLIRPVLVARHVQSGGFSALMSPVRLILKISVLTLLPLIVFVAVFGAELCGALSKGRMSAAHAVLLAMLVQHVPGSNRRFVDVVANIVHCAKVSVQAAFPLLLTAPLAALLLVLWPASGALGVAVLLVVGECLYSAVSAWRFRALGHDYSPTTWRDAWRATLVAAGAAIMLASMATRMTATTTLRLALGVVLAVALVGAGVWALRLFTQTELAEIRQFIRRQPAQDHGGT